MRELVVGRDIAVWSLLDGLAERRLDKALTALRQLYAQGEPPEALLGRDIAPHYRRLMVARVPASAAWNSGASGFGRWAGFWVAR